MLSLFQYIPHTIVRKPVHNQMCNATCLPSTTCLRRFSGFLLVLKQIQYNPNLTFVLALCSTIIVSSTNIFLSNLSQICPLWLSGYSPFHLSDILWSLASWVLVYTLSQMWCPQGSLASTPSPVPRELESSVEMMNFMILWLLLFSSTEP